MTKYFHQSIHFPIGFPHYSEICTVAFKALDVVHIIIKQKTKMSPFHHVILLPASCQRVPKEVRAEQDGAR